MARHPYYHQRRYPEGGKPKTTHDPASNGPGCVDPERVVIRHGHYKVYCPVAKLSEAIQQLQFLSGNWVNNLESPPLDEHRKSQYVSQYKSRDTHLDSPPSNEHKIAVCVSTF